MNRLNMKFRTLKWILLMVFVSLLDTSRGQSLVPTVVSSSGGQSQSGDGYSLSWTLGEAFTTTLANEGLKLTQGFHQPDLEATSGRFRWDNQEITIFLYPNPTNERIYLLPSGDGSFSYRLTSLQGQVLKILTPGPGLREIGLDSFQGGLYLVQVWKDNHQLGTLKFILSR